MNTEFLPLLFAVANISIVAAYWFIARYVAPALKVNSVSKWSAILFFVTCGFTHLEMVIHVLFTTDGFTIADLTNWHAFAIHIPQAFAVWGFVYGLWHSKLVDEDATS